MGTCSVCAQAKRKCDRTRPCSRCVSSGHICKDRVKPLPRYHRKYTRNVCIGCAAAKARCGETRPCDRCVRLGIDCHIPLARTETMLTPYRTGGYLPTPSTEGIFQNLYGFLETVSPFILADLLAGSEMTFFSSMGAMASVIPYKRRSDFLGRVVTLAGLQVSRPEMIGFVSNRVQNFLEPEQASPLLVSEVTYAYNELHTLEHTKAMIEYFMNKHEYTLFPSEEGRRPGVIVSAFLDPRLVDGSNHGLIGTLNPEAEAMTGYTSAEYHGFQNVITPDFSNFDGFPQVLRVYHKDDIHVFMARSLLAFLNPGKEVPYEARLIHKNGHIVPARCATLATMKPDGKMDLFMTVFTALPHTN